MGRQAYPIIGGIIGAAVTWYAGGTGYAAGFALGAAIGGIAGSYIDPILIQGNKIGDTQLQVAAEGGARAIMYGQACVTATCVIARGNRQVIKKKQSNGKGSSGSTQSESVHWTFAIGLCEAMVGSYICRIWQDENLVYDISGSGAVSQDDNAKFQENFRYYNGSEDQLPDTDLQVFLGDDTPYFRGTAYVVFPNFDLTATAERVPTFRFELLNGVVDIVDELETLEWNFPTTSGLHPISQSVTLEGSPNSTWNVDLYFTGQMETRDYANITGVVGGGGRFVTATNSAATTYTNYNVYRITVDHPPQTYYVNNFLPGETAPVLYEPDGGATTKLSIQVAGNATIEYFADPIDGNSAFGPQFGSAKAEVTSIVSDGIGTIPLSDIVSDLIKRTGITEDQFDVTALDDRIAGVCIQSTVTGVDAINACVQPYFADPCEANGVLTFVKRGADVVRTLTVDDLTEDPEIASRENVIEYPAKLSFFYQSPLTGYATTKATSYRYSPQADSSGEGSVTAPETYYNSDEPAQIAQKLHKVMWTEAEGSFTWVVGSHCIDLLPTNTVGLYLRGITTRARITATEFDGSTITLTMLKDRQSSYTSDVSGIPLPTPTPPQPTTMSESVLAVLDIPALQDSDDSLCYYTAVSGLTAVWQGAQLQRSLDAGSSWSPIGDVTTDATMGRLTVAMTATDREYTDTTNTVVVQLFDSGNELLAYSDATFLQEQGAIAIQLTDGTWEVMQYRDVVDNGSGAWTLSYLQRGRLNTIAGAHPVGALFVLLDSQVQKNTAQTAWLQAVLEHRAVSYSTSAEDATIVTQTYVGRSQLEWSPASADADYDGTYVYVHDIIPRWRFGTEVSPIASANFIGYRITISDGTHTVTSDILTTSAHILVPTITTTPTSITVASINKLTGAGDVLGITPNVVTAGSLTPQAIVNAGGGS